MVAPQQKARPRQPAHLLGKEQPGGEILPVPVIQISGYHNESDILCQCQVDHRREGAPRAVVKNSVRKVVTRPQPGQRAVKMDVGRVQKFHRAHPNPWRSTSQCTGRRQ